MSVKSVRLYPDPILRKTTNQLSQLTAHHHQIIASLIDTMRDQPGGIGIAAPQIGYDVPIAVIDVSSKQSHKKRLILINPEVIEGFHPKMGREGCMSLPHYTGNVVRYQQITVQWHDVNMQRHEMATEGFEAVCIQHEVDHLNGLLFLDRVHSLARDVFRRKVYLPHSSTRYKK